MDFEIDHYLEQRNSSSDDSFSIDEDNTSNKHNIYPSLQRFKSLFRHEQKVKQREPTMSSNSCSPKPSLDPRQRRYSQLPLTPPKPEILSTPQPQIIKKLTIDICKTYKKCDPSFRYDPKHNPRRVLTKPGTPYRNNGFDNRNSDYILYVNGGLGGKYVVLELLGFGTFGQVAKCRNTLTGEIVAIKVIKNKPAYFRQSTVEVEILKLLNRKYDPNDQHHILRLLEHFMYKHHLCLVFELLSVNLYDLIKQNSFKGLSTKLIRSFTAQLLDALVILKEAKIIHCDLKPENILLKTMESPVIKVIDFGSACQETNQMYSYIQSRFYRSPEVLLGLDYTSAIDMWSFGCIVTELFLGLPLFPGTSEYNQLSRIIDTFGLPPNHMIEQGKHGGKYFNISRDTNGQVHYTFKSRKVYSAEQNKHEKQSKQYFGTSQLDSLILDFPWPKKEMSQSAIDHELSSRVLLLDFIKRVMCYDPDLRMTPQEALQHPFILHQSLSPTPSERLISSSPSPPLSIKSDTSHSPNDMECICSVSKQFNNHCPNL
ncbi:kinase-like domain-containing protein [Halteromyces radiatus]|uniref:kinase-like domain-containing protein n=1 Tax=Halteromyces radiatus TaxID=101107 RepID=UPI00221EDB15|nr:kinase-like domain-containing protein [Halteromyces radiatus]KAI8084849.1 kinase-like domain-containing protein [Halteromyces radiatus]